MVIALLLVLYQNWACTEPVSAPSQASRKNAVEQALCDKPEEIYSLITLFAKSNDAVLLEGRVPQKLHELF